MFSIASCSLRLQQLSPFYTPLQLAQATCSFYTGTLRAYTLNARHVLICGFLTGDYSSTRKVLQSLLHERNPAALMVLAMAQYDILHQTALAINTLSVCVRYNRSADSGKLGLALNLIALAC